MLTTDERYLEIVKSNVRPKIEPYITVSGEDADGNEIEFQWKPSNIIDMSYKRGIDPTGQTLPYMELTWKEFYFGKFNENNYPEKYNNIVKYMKVDLYFRQDTSKINTWGDVLGGIGGGDVETAKTTWDDFSSDTWDELTGTWDNPAGSSVSVVSEENYTWGDYTPKTWGDIFRSNTFIDIKFPSLILTAKPTIQGHTITWVARDALSFFNEKITKSFQIGIPEANVFKWLFLNERGNFLSSESVITFTSNSQANIPDNLPTLDSLVVFNGYTKDLLRNFASSRGYYWDFKNAKVSGDEYTYAEMIPFVSVAGLTSLFNPVFKFETKIMKSYPEINQGKSISSFSRTKHLWEFDEDNAYTMTPTESLQYTDSVGTVLNYYRYIYKGLAISTAEPEIVSTEVYDLSSSEITVTPVVERTTKEIQNNNKVGEAYIEDNPLYYKDPEYGASRIKSLDIWYSSDKCDMIINSLHNVAIEPGDFVEAETNLYDGDNPITKKGVVLSFELTYNGKLSQKTVVHEVD
jgi:hypothetical protein